MRDKERYFKILNYDFPEFLKDYINTLEMQKQDKISVTCGMYYSKLFNYNWYSSLDHSIAVALIIWHFTHDKVQTLAGLFHDISTPAFKHVIDFLNKDYDEQESTEKLTRKTIENSKEIMNLLEKDNIKVADVYDYHKYSIADNDIPKLSSDRLEYTLSNGLGVVENIFSIDDIREIYNSITILKNEHGVPELGFKDVINAEDFALAASKLSLVYRDQKNKYSMQFLADIIKELVKNNELNVSDLYNLSEEEIINKIHKCKLKELRDKFIKWQNLKEVYSTDELPEDKYYVCVSPKVRYIDPLVIYEGNIKRISDVSLLAAINIERAKYKKTKKYIYSDI